MLYKLYMFILYTVSMYLYIYTLVQYTRIIDIDVLVSTGAAMINPSWRRCFWGLIAQPPTSLELSHLISLEVITIVVTYQGHVCQHQDMWYVNTMCPHSYSSASTIIPHTVGSVPKDPYNWVKLDYMSKCGLYSIHVIPYQHHPYVSIPSRDLIYKYHLIHCLIYYLKNRLICIV